MKLSLDLSLEYDAIDSDTARKSQTEQRIKIKNEECLANRILEFRDKI